MFLIARAVPLPAAVTSSGETETDGGARRLPFTPTLPARLRRSLHNAEGERRLPGVRLDAPA